MGKSLKILAKIFWVSGLEILFIYTSTCVALTSRRAEISSRGLYHLISFFEIKYDCVNRREDFPYIGAIIASITQNMVDRCNKDIFLERMAVICSLYATVKTKSYAKTQQF